MAVVAVFRSYFIKGRKIISPIVRSLNMKFANCTIEQKSTLNIFFRHSFKVAVEFASGSPPQKRLLLVARRWIS